MPRMSVCVRASVCICVCVRVYVLELIRKIFKRWLELNMGPLEEQQVLLTTEPPLQPSGRVLKGKIHKRASNFVLIMTDGSKWFDLELKCLLEVAV